MTGDMTSVPLRPKDRWTAARMQQGRVLLDTDWNLDIDGPARDARELAADAIGPAGVPIGSSAFEVSVSGGVLTIGAGNMWVDGLLARNPSDLSYADQSQISPLPTSGLWIVYLDAFPEEVQAAEDPTDLLDPALDGIDTTTRTRVGWRVRLGQATAPKCGATTFPAALSTGLLTVARSAAPVSPDPCAPPDDPRSKLPDGLLRIEVLDHGSESTARFGWSFANGSDAVAAQVAGTAVTLAPSRAVSFSVGDLAEVSTLARREDRIDHGTLFTVMGVTSGAGGDRITLDAPSALTGNPPGTCLRRWDGQAVGAASAVTLTLAGQDTGITFTAGAGNYEVGDWWGVRVRGSAADSVETLTAAPPDGIKHSFASLAVVDLSKGAVLSDCRPQFPPLTAQRDECTCTVTAFPGDDLQAKADLLPDTGGELCLAAGRFVLQQPVTIDNKENIVITGVGPATVLASVNHEAALIATGCDNIEVTHLRVVTAVAQDRPKPPGDQHLMGGLSFYGGDGIRVHDVEVQAPSGPVRTQSGIYVNSSRDGGIPDNVEIVDCRVKVGDLQVGILVADAPTTRIGNNHVSLLFDEHILVPVRKADVYGDYIASYMDATAAQRSGARGAPLDLTFANGDKVAVHGPSEVRRLITEAHRTITSADLAGNRTPRALVAKFVRDKMLAKDALVAGELTGVNSVANYAMRAVGQGIVVAGSQAVNVRIEGNLVEGAIQGIHVGLQQRGELNLRARQVVVSDNTVHASVPYYWTRQRHAFYVGNVDTLLMKDNFADLQRWKRLDGATPVDACRIWGVLGSFIQVRGMALTGPFRTGVVVRDTAPEPDFRDAIWYISDVLNIDGMALDVPTSFQTDRCAP